MSAHFSSTVTVVRYTSTSFFFQEVSTSVLITDTPRKTTSKPDCFDALLNRGPSDLDIIRHTILKLANKSPTLFIESDSDEESEEWSSDSDSSSESDDSSEDTYEYSDNDESVPKKDT